MLYRVFPSVPGARDDAPGGSLHVPRERQGTGRHDHPDRYGALYVSRSAESAVAERIQGFRGQTLTNADLRLVGGVQYALATFEDIRGTIVDLDDPAELVARDLRPSMVATHQRAVTRALALRIFEEGAVGLAWWSSLEASWSNLTLFAERAAGGLVIAELPELLSVEHPVLRSAAEAIGVRLSSRDFKS